MTSDAKADRIQDVLALVKRLEARARRTKDKDLIRAGTLLRVLMTVMSERDGEPCPVIDPVIDLAAFRGRAH
jgi:hypothetical protein